MNKKLLLAFKRSKKTCYWLAQQTGINERGLGRWKAGQTDIRLSTAEKIAKALGVKIELSAANRKTQDSI